MKFTCRLYVKLLEELSRSMIKACIFIKIFEQNYCGKKTFVDGVLYAVFGH